jgi:hypothetical protein
LRLALARMLTPQLECTVDVQTSRGRKVIRVLVPRGDDPPYAVEESKIYVREEAETSLAVRDEIVQLVLRRPAAPAPVAEPAAVEPTGELRRQPRSQPALERPPVNDTVVRAPVAAVEARPAPLASPVPAAAPARAVGSPRTGVEIVATDERDGVRYHTMRDLRNGSVVKNVTRASARKLWHYAISAKEASELKPNSVNWQGDIGLWRKTQKGGATRYDLVQRVGDQLRVYYGVTEDGIHGAWKRLAEIEDREAPAAPPVEAEAVAIAAPVAEVPEIAPGPDYAAPDAAPGVPVEVEALPAPALDLTEAIEALPIPEAALEAGEPANGLEPAAEAASPRRRGAAKKGSAKKSARKGTAAKRPSTKAAKKTAAKSPTRRSRKPAAELEPETGAS